MLCHLYRILGIDRFLIHSPLRKPDTSLLLQVQRRDNHHFFSSSSSIPGKSLNISSIPTLESSPAVSQEAFLLKKEPILSRFSLRGRWVSSNFSLHTSTRSLTRKRWISNPTEAGFSAPIDDPILSSKRKRWPTKRNSTFNYFP